MSLPEASRESVIHYVQSNLDSITFKSLKRDEQDTPDDEKLAVMDKTLANDPGLFLTRWGRFLPQEELKHFEPLRATNYEVDVNLQSLLKGQSGNVEIAQQANAHIRKQVQNRRFQYLKDVLIGSEYFSEQAMQLREPGLYEYYIGQHIPPHLRDRPYGEDVNLVQRIMHNLDRSIIDEKLRQQKLIESEQEEEEEEEEEEDDEDEVEVDENMDQANDSMEAEEMNNAEPVIAPLSTSLRDKSAEARRKLEENIFHKSEPTDSGTQAEREQHFRDGQKEEFVRMMEELFLEGKDPSFDYKEVDENEKYDDLDQEDMDMQDKYFDEEDEEVEESKSKGTGVYDY